MWACQASEAQTVADVVMLLASSLCRNDSFVIHILLSGSKTTIFPYSGSRNVRRYQQDCVCMALAKLMLPFYYRYVSFIISLLAESVPMRFLELMLVTLLN
jgi:hypothetical protein